MAFGILKDTFMRIGLFSDTYRPTINGITFVVETLKNQLEALGHEVYVFCPARTMVPSLKREYALEDEHIVRLPSFPSGFFDDFDLSVFFPPLVLRQIKELNLDVIHIFTPSQIGLLGINAAVKYDIPLVVQHCTDLYEFSENYPGTLPGSLTLVGVVFPMSIKLNGKDVREILKLYRPHRSATHWNQKVISKAITMLYSKADAVIALSRKSYDQLKGWQDKRYSYDVSLLPNGVDMLPKPSAKELSDFREMWGLEDGDEVFGFVGRLGEEKNLPILIKAMDKIGRDRPKAKLLFVGDFEYRATLEEMARASKYPERIIFTGAMPRERLGLAYAALDVFVFPSLKDTQGWVLHEAAHAGLPIVLIDRGVSEVMNDGESGYFAKNNVTDVARKVTALLKDSDVRAAFGKRSKELARRFTEKKQVKKLVTLYDGVIARHGEKERPKRPNRARQLLRRLGGTTNE